MAVDPLGYPGVPLDRPGLLTRTSFDETFPVAQLADRTPVAAVGSNADPETLRRKLAGTSMIVPVQLVDVYGIAPGVSAHVSKPGYVPATPVPAPGRTACLVVAWLDPEQLRAMDATEPNYQRVRLSADQLPLQSPGWMYASRHGWLVDADGNPRPLRPQPELLTTLLAESKALRALAGPTPASFVERMRAADVREQVRLLFVRERWVRGTTGTTSAFPPTTTASPEPPPAHDASDPAPTC